MKTTRRNWKWAAAACAVVGFFVGRESVLEGVTRSDLAEEEDLRRSVERQFHELWNEHAAFADALGRESFAEEIRLRFEPTEAELRDY